MFAILKKLLWPLGVCVSLDATFKLAQKARIVDKAYNHESPYRGGLVTMINEHSEILAWVRTAFKSS